MKILITGIAGFIGFHTALHMKSKGHHVVGIDNFNNVIYDDKLKFDRAELLEANGIEIEDGDIVDYRSLYSFMGTIQPDLVIHLAAHAGVRVSLDQPSNYIQNNIVGTQNLITCMEKFGIDNVIYASTSCVMEGNPLPWGPDCNVGKQLSPYGYTKLTNENQFHTSKIKNAVCLRFFTVYGPWGRPDMALFTFTEKILAGQPIDVYNYGNMKRDFTYVDDIVQGIDIVSQNMSERETYCIGYGQQVNLMDFITEIENSLEMTSEKQFKPRHPADALETWSDTTKLQALGYRPTTPIADGVRNFVYWYRNYYGRNDA